MNRSRQSHSGERGVRRRKLAKRVTGIAVGAALVMATIAPSVNVTARSFHMSYIFYGDADTVVSQVADTQGALSIVSPSFFDVDADGSLKLSAMFSPDTARRLQRMGVKVVPFLSNHWDRNLGQKALDNRAALADELADAVRTYGLNGVNVDIENVPETYRTQYVDFVRLLRDKLPDEAEVSVAVAANPDGWTQGWQASYDYAALAEAADYLMLMAYDQSYQTGPEGPVAGLPWVERSVRYALNEGVPANKLVLGLAFYGRYWLQGSEDPAHLGMGVSNAKIAEWIERYDGIVSYDAASSTPKLTFSIEPGDPRTQVAGRTLPDGTYHVYYENNDSLRQKVELAGRYGLKGTGSWSLGQEEQSFWDEYGDWMESGLLPPSGDDSSSGASYLPFGDVSDGHWAKPSIASVFAKGWMEGQSPVSFAPDASLTRAEAAAILVRMLGVPPSGQAQHAPFRDVPVAHWARPAIAAAFAHGLFEGAGADTFAPDAPITREQMAVILDRLAAKMNVAGASSSPLRFTDVAANRWSYDAVVRMAAWGVLQGYGNGEFRPERRLTRAEAAAMLLRMSDLIAPGPGNVPGQSPGATATLIKHGMQGAEVTALQSTLAALGYFNREATGYFGDVTLSAVKQFQRDQGLDDDGIVGPKTADKLQAAFAARDGGGHP